MAVELRVPSVGESITEVQIGEWLKSEGQSVQKDEIVAMIETDKVTVELPAPVKGVLTKIVVQQGQPAAVGDVIGYMEEGGAADATAKPKTDGRESAPKPEPQKAAPAPAEVEVKDTQAEVKDTRAVAKDTRAEAKDTRAEAKDTRAARAEAADGEAPRSVRDSLPPQAFARVMPSARRVLKEKELRAEDVKGTGPGGRVLKEDVERQALEGESKKRGPEPAPDHADRDEEVVAMSPMRRRIAQRLVQSQQQAALLTTFNEIDMNAVLGLRKEHQEAFQKKYSIKLGFMSFFVKGAIEALKLVPAVNGEIRGSEIVYKNYFDIGVAVGGGKGLVVPVIRSADRLSFAELEQKIADLAKRAQDNKLKLEELEGGTFTISNGGIYGSLLSTPIINPPQSGILGMHAIQERPVVRDGQIVVRPMMYVALTYDHRLVDGREAVTFLKRVKECVESPERILLEV
jgi:2-oxoglutarate dehydrogenase E2 component (dihydrolipoamide succinyltransferase)